MRPLGLALALVLAWFAVGAAEPYDVRIRRNTHGDPVVVIGDLQGRALPLPLITALAFLGSWHKREVVGGPTVTVAGAPATLDQVIVGVPISGFDLTDETVSVHAVPILHQGKSRMTVVKLDLERVGDRWRVRSVAIE